MNTLKKISKKLVTQYIDPHGPFHIGWPPACTALLYQPERPASIKAKESMGSKKVTDK